MLLAIILIVAYVAILIAVGVLLLSLAVKVMQLACVFCKISFAMLISLLLTSDVVLVQSGFWNWFLFALILYAVIFILSGFPRVNRAFDFFTGLIITFFLSLFVGAILMVIYSWIAGEDSALYTFWTRNYTVICLVLSCFGPVLVNYLQRNFSVTTAEKVGSAEVRTGLISKQTVKLYADSTSYYDMSRHFFTFGDRWPVFQRILAALIYSIYPLIIIMCLLTDLWNLKDGFFPWLVFFVVTGILTALAYLIQLKLEQRAAKRAAEQEAAFLCPAAEGGDAFAEFPA